MGDLEAAKWFSIPRKDEKTREGLTELAEDLETPKLNINVPFPEVPQNEYWNNPLFYDEQLFHEHGGIYDKVPKENQISNFRGEEREMTFGYDAGLYWYRVTAADIPEKTINTRIFMLRRLATIPKFSYLSSLPEKEKTESLNVKPEHIKPGQIIPVPLPMEARKLSPEQILNHSFEAIERMKTEPKYKEDFETIMEHWTEQEIAEILYMVTMQESGGGRTAYHRWEDHKSAFSFSITQPVMIKGSPGFNARLRLGLTEGQTMHPTFGLMLALGFLIEETKCRNIPKGKEEGIFDIDKFILQKDENGNFDYSKFARRYNGADHAKNKYLPRIKKYHQDARAKMQSAKPGLMSVPKPTSQPELPPIPFAVNPKPAPKPSESEKVAELIIPDITPRIKPTPPKAELQELQAEVAPTPAPKPTPEPKAPEKVKVEYPIHTVDQGENMFKIALAAQQDYKPHYDQKGVGQIVEGIRKLNEKPDTNVDILEKLKMPSYQNPMEIFDL